MLKPLPCIGLLLSVLAGCHQSPQTDYSQVDLQPVQGQVKLDGQPLSNAVITFNDEQDGTFSYALTDQDGKYRLRFDSQMEGCKPGKKRVEISTTRKILGLNTSEEGGDPDAKKPAEKIPAKYNRKSELAVEVTPEQVNFPFDLTSQ